ncbi:MAG: PQQ-binding-like beta-propeller repeat protein, partial [Planctomycetota bacterium]|nr:PQQ-binding-like beta-propeller repeat protein [Planctomycetota bacterium]
AVSAILKFFEERGTNYVVRDGTAYYGAKTLLKRWLTALPDEVVKNFATDMYKKAETTLRIGQNNPSLLWSLFERLASSSQIERALKILSEYYLERGDFSSVLKATRQACEAIQRIEDEQTRFYTALAMAATGKKSEAEKEVKEIKKRVHFGGKEWNAQEALAQFSKWMPTEESRIKPEEIKKEIRLLPPGVPRYLPLKSPFGANELKIAGAPAIPTISGDSILVNTGKTVVKMKEGRVEWTVPLVTEDLPQAYYYSRGFKVATDGVSAYFSDKDRVRAYKLSDSSFSWCSDQIDSLVLSDPVVCGEDVFVYVLSKEREFKSFLLCLDSSTGRQKWFAPISTGFPLNPFNSTVFALPPVVCDERIFVISSFELFSALSREGELLWAFRYPTTYGHLNARRTAENRRRTVSYPLLLNDIIIAIPPDSLYAFAFSTKQPKILWRLPTEGEWKVNGFCALADKNSVAFFGSHIIILDAKTGLIKELSPLPEDVYSAFVDSESLWLLSEKSLFRYKTGEMELEEFFVPELRGVFNLTASGRNLVAISPNEAVLWSSLENAAEDVVMLRRGDVKRLQERLRDRDFCAILRREGDDMRAVLEPLLARLKEKNPAQCAKILETISEHLSIERRGTSLVEAACLYSKSGDYEKALDVLASSVNHPCEVIELGYLKTVPMPETAAALALSIAKNAPEGVLRRAEEKTQSIERRDTSIEDMKRLFYSYPYTTTGREAAAEVARRLIAEKRTEEAEMWLYSLLRLDSGQEPSYLELLLRIYQMVGDDIRCQWAKQTLSALKESKPPPQANTPLHPPERIAWRNLPYLVTDESMDAVIVRIKDRAGVLRFGETVMDAVDAENGTLLWRVSLTRSSSVIQLPDGRIVVLSGELLAVIDSESGDVLKKIEVKGLDEKSRERTTVFLFAVAQDRVCLIDTKGCVAIVDLKNGRVILDEKVLKVALGGVAVGDALSCGDMIVIRSIDAKRLLFFDTTRMILTRTQNAQKNESFVRSITDGRSCL